MRVLRDHSWLVVLVVIALAVMLSFGSREAGWWRQVFVGRSLEFETLSVAELPLPLLEIYGSSRWHEGVDAHYDVETGMLNVLIRWGQQPTGGHRIVPISANLIRRTGGYQVRVRAEYITPAPGQPVIEVLTFPAVGVQIDLGQDGPAKLRVVVLDHRGKVKGSSGELP